MEVTNIIVNISISLVVGGGSGFAIFKWLGKKWITHWFDRDMEKYKQQLDLLKMQKHLQFSNIYVQRAEVIRETYKLMARLVVANNTVKGVKFRNAEEEQKTYQQYCDALSKLYYYIIDNGIYLPQTTFDKLIVFTDCVGKEVVPKVVGLNEILSPEIIDAINNIPDYNLAEIVNELKTEFQGLLGIIKETR